MNAWIIWFVYLIPVGSHFQSFESRDTLRLARQGYDFDEYHTRSPSDAHDEAHLNDGQPMFEEAEQEQGAHTFHDLPAEYEPIYQRPKRNGTRRNPSISSAPAPAPYPGPAPNYHGHPENVFIDYNTVPGKPGVDYPSHAYVPLTKFYCYNHPHPGYYADVEAGCQVFHVCDVDGRQDSFLCPRGTIFSQTLFICDWWFNVACNEAPDYYHLNQELHKKKKKRPGHSKSAPEVQLSPPPPPHSGNYEHK